MIHPYGNDTVLNEVIERALGEALWETEEDIRSNDLNFITLYLREKEISVITIQEFMHRLKQLKVAIKSPRLFHLGILSQKILARVLNHWCECYSDNILHSPSYAIKMKDIYITDFDTESLFLYLFFEEELDCLDTITTYDLHYSFFDPKTVWQEEPEDDWYTTAPLSELPDEEEK